MTTVARPLGRSQRRTAKSGWTEFDALTPGQAFSFWLILIPAIIDYRFRVTTAGSTALYAVMVLGAVGGAMALLIRGGIRHAAIQRAALLSVAFWIEVCGIGLLRGQHLVDVVRASPPLFLFALGLIGVGALAASGADARAVWRQTLIAAALGVLMQLLIVSFAQGINFLTVRYEILSGAAPLISGYAVSLLLFGGVTVTALALILLHVGTIALSVTRTQIVVAMLPVAMALVGTRARVLAIKGVGRRLLVVGGVILVGVAVASVLPGAPLERWAQRLFEAQTETRGLDITAMTRAGEAKFQIGRLTSSVVGLLFGFGISAPTAFDPDTAKLVEALVGSNTGYFTETGIGHNNYVGVIFIGGILAGGAFLWLHLMGAVRAVKMIAALSQPALFNRFGGLIAVPLAYFGYLAFGLLGATNGGRGSSLLMGISLGLVLWIYDAVHEPPPTAK